MRASASVVCAMWRRRTVTHASSVLFFGVGRTRRRSRPDWYSREVSSEATVYQNVIVVSVVVCCPGAARSTARLCCAVLGSRCTAAGSWRVELPGSSPAIHCTDAAQPGDAV